MKNVKKEFLKSIYGQSLRIRINHRVGEVEVEFIFETRFTGGGSGSIMSIPFVSILLRPRHRCGMYVFLL